MLRADLDVRLLGPLQVRRDGSVLDIGGPKQRAVLALLVLDVGRVVSTARLVDELWAGDPPASGTVTVQGYIAGLRRALEPGRSAARSSVLATESPGYVLRLDPEQVDRFRFERAADAGARALRDGDPEAALRRLDEALAIYTGDALADLSGEAFAGPVVAQLEERRLVAVEDRNDARLLVGDHRSLVGELEPLVTQHPLRERLASQRVLALYRSDRQADALRAYTWTRDRLVDELGIEPGPALRELEAAILRQDPDLAWSSTNAGGDTVGAGAGADRPSGNVGAPTPVGDERAAAPVTVDDLVERDGAVAVLDAAWRDVRDGTTRIVLAEGMAGHGKTSVVEAFVDRLDPTVAVAWGRCPDHDGAPDLWPWRQALRALADDGPPPPSATVDPGPAAQFGWYDDLATWLTDRAARGPCVVVLDDVHRADLPSLETLRYVVANVRGAPLLLIATQRPLPPGGTAAMEDAIGALVRDRRCERVVLDALSPAGVRTLTERVSGMALGDEDLAVVMRRTNGSPWIVVAIAVDAARTGLAPSQVPIPSAMRTLGRRALAHAGPDGAIIAAAAGALGHEFDVADVARVADRDMETTLAAIEGLASRLYLQRATDPRRYQWAVGVLGELAVEELPGVERAALHARAAQVLGERLDRLPSTDPGRPALVEDVVDHVIQSVDAIATDRGLRLIETVSGRGEHDERSRRLLEQAARALDDLAPTAERANAALRLRARLLDLSLRHDGLGSASARGHAELLRAPDRPDDQPARRALGDWLQVQQPLLAADRRRAVGALERFGEVEPGSYPAALLTSATAMVRLHEGHVGEALELLRAVAPGTRRPSTEHERSGPLDPVHEVTSAYLAIAIAASGADDDASEPMALAVADAERREPWLLALVQCLAGWLAVERDDAEVAARIGADAARFAAEHGADQFVRWARTIEAWGAGMSGAVDPAEAAVQLSAEADALERTGLAVLRGVHHLGQAQLLGRAGQDEPAAAERNRARAWAERTGFWFGIDVER